MWPSGSRCWISAGSSPAEHRPRCARTPTSSPPISGKRRPPLLDLVMQAIASGVAIGCVYGLIGIGFCVIYNASGIVNFAQGAFVMLGGMVTYVAMTRFSLPLPLAAIVSIAVVSLIGVALERLVVRPLWNRNSTMFVMIL